MIFRGLARLARREIDGLIYTAGGGSGGGAGSMAGGSGIGTNGDGDGLLGNSDGGGDGVCSVISLEIQADFLNIAGIRREDIVGSLVEQIVYQFVCVFSSTRFPNTRGSRAAAGSLYILYTSSFA